MIRSVIFLLLLSTGLNAQMIDDRVDLVDYATFKDKYFQADDETVVFNFWATWCKPCVKELPYFLEYAEQDEVRLVLVSLDFPQHVRTKVIPFLKDREITQEVVLMNERNANVFIDDIEPSWQGSIPATLIWKGQKKGFAEKEFHSTDELRAFVKESLE